MSEAMDIGDIIERAFCGSVTVRHVPAGLAVSTAYTLTDGDRLGFYLVRANGGYRIEDDGSTIPFIEAGGVSLDVETRARAFRDLLDEYKVEYDEDEGELRTPLLSEAEVPGAAMRFVALLLRLQDFTLLHPEIVANTFREDARSAIERAFIGKATVQFDAVLTALVPDIAVDVLVQGEGADPVAVILGTTDKRILEAQLLRVLARYEAHIRCKVVALLERPHPRSLTDKGLERAMNSLDRVLAFRGSEHAAIATLQELALGQTVH